MFFFGSMMGMVVIQLGVSELPPPWRQINALFLFLMILFMIRETGAVVWLSFFVHFIMELYATTPFGIVLFAGTVGMLVSVWLFHQFLTNRSWYTMFVLTASAILLYRLLYTVLLFIVSTRGYTVMPPWTFLLQTYGSEIALTACVATISYAFIEHVARRKRPVRIFSLGLFTK